MNIQVTVHNFSYNSEARRVLYYLQSILLFAREKGKMAVKRTQAVGKKNERKLKLLLLIFFLSYNKNNFCNALEKVHAFSVL